MKFEIKDKVKLIAPVSYLKTSDNMPMLRPPDLVAIDEIGEILSIFGASINARHSTSLDNIVLNVVTLDSMKKSEVINLS